MAKDKDTIYVDIDDEITGIIDKVKGSDGKIVALVLPKRATVFQSIVNMKLLKRAAESSKKNLVLITSEAGLLPLAGAAGVHVAKTLTSKPAIPIGPETDDGDAEEVDEDVTDELEDSLDPNAAVGALAAAGAAGAVASNGDDVETLDLDNTDLPGGDSPTKKSFEPPKKDKKLKVPDFDRFRLWLIGGGAALILLIIGFVVANSVLPSAKILIKTNSRAVDASISLNLSTDAKTLAIQDSTVPAKTVTVKKTYTQSVPATGQKNNGNKATGSIKMTAVECGVATPSDVPAGTGVSSGGHTYITGENTTFAFHHIQSGCIYFTATANTSITAQNGGSDYNISNASFTVAGHSDVTGKGSASGGTDDIVKVVSQSDLSNAKSKITADDNVIKKDLSSQLKDLNLYPIVATYSAGNPDVSSSPGVGEQADSVTVTQVVTYTMFGVKEDDINTLLNNAIRGQIDPNQQSILDNGLNDMVFNVDSMSDKTAQVSGSTTATAGPELDIETIKRDAAGKKPGAVKDSLSSNSDVQDVQVKLSPFWVSSVPKKTSKIQVVIAKPSKTDVGQ